VGKPGFGSLEMVETWDITFRIGRLSPVPVHKSPVIPAPLTPILYDIRKKIIPAAGNPRVWENPLNLRPILIVDCWYIVEISG
jgi:hypothetical protein